jgi:genome maintenance exonuclease 1
MIDFIDPVIEQINTDNGRFYQMDGVKVPSVTTVLSVMEGDWLKAWKDRVGEDEAARVSRRASNRGTLLHEMCENYLNGLSYDHDMKFVNPESKFMFNNLKCELDKISEVYGLEKRLFAKKFGLAGTVDCVGVYDDNLSIIDFKTSNKVKYREDIPNYFAQCAAYSIMIYEMYGVRIRNCAILITCFEAGKSVVYQDDVTNWFGYLKEAKQKYYEVQNDSTTHAD